MSLVSATVDMAHGIYSYRARYYHPTASYNGANQQVTWGPQTMTYDLNGNLATQPGRSFTSGLVCVPMRRLKTLFSASYAAILADAANLRQTLVLNHLLDGFEGRLTTSKYAQLTKSSQDTAMRDIIPLLERGILVRGPEGGRSTSYALGNASRGDEGAAQEATPDSTPVNRIWTRGS